jgi:integrase
MKARKEHKVPLGKRAIELLRALPREAGGFHFIGSKEAKASASTALSL